MLLLQIEIDSKWLDANLTVGSSISMEETSQVWSLSGGRSSIPFTLSVHENQHIVGNVSDMRGSSVFKRLYGARFRLYVGGILFRTGVVHLDSTVHVTDTIEIELVGNGKEWAELIEDLDCRKVPLMSDVQLGVSYQSKLEVFLSGKYKWQSFFTFNGSTAYTIWYDIADNPDSQTQNKRVSVGEIDFPHALMPKDGNGNLLVNESESYSKSHPFCNLRICWNAKDKDGNKLNLFTVFEANRTNTSPCFYVLYFFDCLFSHLGVSCTRNDMKLYDEMKRLAFVNTGCFYETKGEHVGKMKPSDMGFRIAIEDSISGTYENGAGWKLKDLKVEFSSKSEVNLYNAYATPENFPNKSVSNVLNAIQNLFGARFLFDSSRQEMQIVFVRDILKQSDVTDIPCRIIKCNPIYEHKEGFRLRYGEDVKEEDVNEKDLNRDTAFNMPHLRTTRNDVTFENVPLSAYNKTFYIDPITGNGYLNKVDKEAKEADKLHPAIMEAAQFCRVEYGDCSEEDFVEEVSIDARPVIMSNVSSQLKDEKFAFYADVDMNNKETETRVTNPVKIWGHPYGYSGTINIENIPIELRHKFEPSFDISENIESPLDEYDCGLTLGFMRGPGSDAGTEIFNENYDGEGNSQWVTVASNSTFHADTMDDYGNQFDYNGSGDVSETPGDTPTPSEKIEIDITDKQSAAELLRRLFPYSNTDLLAAARYSSKVSSGRGTIFNAMYWNGYGGYRYIYTRIREDGTVWEENANYASMIGVDQTTDFSFILNNDKKLGKFVLGRCNSMYGNELLDLLEKVAMMYFTNTSGKVSVSRALLNMASDNPNPSIPSTGNGIGGDAQRISLKLKAEKLIDGKYLPVTGAGAARRGIFDNFYEDYAYWVTHRKLAHIEAEVELADLINLDMTKKYRIGDYIGFLKSCNYDVTDSGLGIVTFELYYL